MVAFVWAFVWFYSAVLPANLSPLANRENPGTPGSQSSKAHPPSCFHPRAAPYRLVGKKKKKRVYTSSQRGNKLAVQLDAVVNKW
ncbi:hypothetical protein BOTBODRAFT_250818 [Botryobasidium botryosum FD-172 SS1]|uniref:Secreted protein n=1 Tax=Botryobasidium botryosum (strain FD-172 SS1) TaxID=930990 RepID=A0A067MY74_BOTB1|nr:hypothetical protein BOTBODRAFT_250818 [Botryobasidium botryosum FD-172 SS1]